MLVITTEEWIGIGTMVVSLCVSGFFLGSGLGFMSGLRVGRKDRPKPIAYPEDSLVKKTYSAIIDQIKKAKNPSDLYAAYDSIIKFKHDFTDEEWLLSLLEKLYNQKEEEINNMVV